jgi:type III secretion protein U
MSQGSGGEKTEQPTPKRLRDARKKGQVARSQEIVTSTTLFAAIAYVWWNWGGFMQPMIEMMDMVARLAAGGSPDAGVKAIIYVFWEVTRMLAPLILVVIAFGIYSNYAQVGSLFAVEAIKPKMENISFKKGIKKIFSKKQLVELLKSIVKIGFLSTLLVMVFRSYLGVAMMALPCGIPCLTEITVQMLKVLFICAALAFLVIALFDITYQRRAHTKSLMMTKNEVKREYKENEGDPMIKGQRRQLAQELIMSESVSNTRKATAVVVNPTHFAVAIRYEPEKFRLPHVTAKGRNLMAAMIRAEAEKVGVPVFLNVPLARALYANSEVHDPVPENLFKPVAEILVWVQRNKELLYRGPLDKGVIDMARGDHRPKRSE